MWPREWVEFDIIGPAARLMSVNAWQIHEWVHVSEVLSWTLTRTRGRTGAVCRTFVPYWIFAGRHFEIPRVSRGWMVGEWSVDDGMG